MIVPKLYRKPMAELANITPTQLDYFVKLGAFAPDLGDRRKHFSTFEAAMVLIAGQLSPVVKDQKTIVSALNTLRDWLALSGTHPKTYSEYLQLCCIDAAQSEMGILWNATPPLKPDTDKLRAKTEIQWMLLQNGKYANVRWLTKQHLAEIEDLLGKKLSDEAEASKSALVRSALSLKVLGFPKDDLGLDPSFTMKGEYLSAVEGSNAPVFLQFAPNADGTSAVAIDYEPVELEGRITWTTLDLGALFKRLKPFVDMEKTIQIHHFEHEAGVSRANAPNQNCGLLEALG